MRKISVISDVVMMNVRNFVDERGGLAVVSEKTDVPFEIRECTLRTTQGST